MEKRVSNALNYFLWLSVAAVLLFFCFKGVDWSAFWDGLRSCRWEFIAMSMGFGALSFWFRGLRWRELLLPIDPSTKRLTVFNAVNISYVANMVLPRLGEIVRCGYITRHSAKDEGGQRLASFDKVFGTVLVDRIWDMLTLGLLVLVMLLPMGGRFSQVLGANEAGMKPDVPWLLVGAVLAMALVLCLIWFFRDRNALCGKIWGFLEGILKGVGSCLKMKGWWKFILYTLLIWGCYWMTSVCILEAVQGRLPGFETLTLTDALFLMVVGSISTVVPVPGGFGAYHYLISLSLSTLYGIPTEVGLIWATLSHESQALMQVLAGGWSFLHETVRK